MSKHSLSGIVAFDEVTIVMPCALVAQRIERLVAVQKVAGSIPAERTKKYSSSVLV